MPIVLRAALVLALGAAGTATAQDAPPPIENGVAQFTGLDKITGRLNTFDVLIGEPVQFGALIITPRVCYSREPTVQQQTSTFVEIDEITLENQIQRIFGGWMFAESPGLNSVEHPVYDVWLTACKPREEYVDPTQALAEQPDEGDAPAGPEYLGGIPIPRPKPTTVPQSSQSFRDIVPPDQIGEGGTIIELPPPL